MVEEEEDGEFQIFSNFILCLKIDMIVKDKSKQVVKMLN